MKSGILIGIMLLSVLTSVTAQQTGCISGSCEDGPGKYIYDNGYIYEGNFIKGLRSGMGKLESPTGDVYEGMWENDQFNGQGTYTWADKSKYTGEWKNGVQDGYGIFFYTNGDKYNGYFRNNQFHGKGKYTWADGSVQEGSYENGVFVSN
jgi:1-phosphatidylinositol-4-phosphate 5-kinase